jgi:hypothetical protein
LPRIFFTRQIRIDSYKLEKVSQSRNITDVIRARDNGDTYDPLGFLHQKSVVNGLRVSFSVRICEDHAIVHMWRYLVEVLSIQKLL